MDPLRQEKLRTFVTSSNVGNTSLTNGQNLTPSNCMAESATYLSASSLLNTNLQN